MTARETLGRWVSLATLLVAGSAAGHPCPADGVTEQWTGTLHGRAVRCCARHALFRTRIIDVDGLLAWCDRGPRRSLVVPIIEDPRTGHVAGDDLARACRVGPHLRRPVSVKPLRIRQQGCCRLTTTDVTGDFVTHSAGGAFVVTGPLTGFRGNVRCRGHGAWAVALAREGPSQRPADGARITAGGSQRTDP
jgi:hypothetical protein